MTYANFTNASMGWKPPGGERRSHQGAIELLNRVSPDPPEHGH
jgi:hypothetical protein